MKVGLVLNQVPGGEGIWRNGDLGPHILEHNTIYIRVCGQLHIQAALTPKLIQSEAALNLFHVTT